MRSGALSRRATATTIVELTRNVIAEHLQGGLELLGGAFAADRLLPGKMLRTQLAGRLAAAGCPAEMETLAYGCAAVEMVHTASLCHDDLIDGAEIRRGGATLWREAGAPAAVLIGDVLLCQAIDLISLAGHGQCVRQFVRQVAVACAAEVRGELVLRQKELDEETCVELARGKTGALFGFVASLAAGADETLAAALSKAGTAVGAAYQLADDLLDVTGDEASAGKTLGTDAARGKCTLAATPEGQRRLVETVSDLVNEARGAVAGYPAAWQGLTDFLEWDMQPLLDRQGLRLGVA